MKRDDILTAVGLIDDAFIAETAAVRKKHKLQVVRTLVSLAACIAVILSGIWVYSKTRLPLLEIEITHHLSGSGIDLLCYDIASHDETNPWDSKTPIRRMPVYKNLPIDALGLPIGGLSENEKLSLGRKAANTLGLTVIETQSQSLPIITDGGAIMVDAYGTITVGGLEESYTFYRNSDFTQAEKALTYFTEKYADLLGFKQPTPILTSTFAFSGERSYHYVVYEGADTAAERVLNYACRYAVFYPDENGKLNVIRVYNALAAAKKLGNYPVISSNEAYELLLEGYHVNTHLKDRPVTKDTIIHKQTLVYRATTDDATILPYYVFYVEDPTTYYGVAEGLTAYNAYYVPAVDRKYIKSMPLWDGTTNK